MTTETEILKMLFPPGGAIPIERIDDIATIRSNIATIIRLASGQRIGNCYRDSRAITERVVALKESVGDDGLPRTWAEIADEVGLTAKAAQMRYRSYRLRHASAERALAADTTTRDEAYASMSGDVSGAEQGIEPMTITSSPPRQETSEIPSQSEPGAATDSQEHPRDIPGIEIDVRIDDLRSKGLSSHRISAQLEKEGIKLDRLEVRARMQAMNREKNQRKKEQAASEPSEKPEPKAIGRAELDARIWDLHKAGQSIEQISDALYAEGLYYSEKAVRVRLLSQGAVL